MRGLFRGIVDVVTVTGIAVNRPLVYIYICIDRRSKRMYRRFYTARRYPVNVHMLWPCRLTNRGPLFRLAFQPVNEHMLWSSSNAYF